MSILSSVKSVASKAVGAVKSAASGLGNLLSGGKNNAAAATLTYPVSTPKTNQTLLPNISTPAGIGQTQSNGSIILVNNQGRPTGGVINASGVGSTIAPTMSSPIYSAPVTLAGGSRPNSGASGSWSSPSISTSSLSFAPTSSGSISAETLASAPSPISAPSAPSYANPGQINNAGLISSLSDTHTYDPSTNTFTANTATDPNQQTDAQKRNALQETLLKLIPQKNNVLDTPEVQKQQEEVNRAKQEVANYTSQLNTVVAQQNADLLRLRGIGSQEGVTETVYGGQAATINREAAIKALPIQAQLSAAQGNLQLAQDYLTQLTTWKTEQINNDYEYRKNVYASMADYVKGELKDQLDAKNKANDRAFELTKMNIGLQDDLMKEAINSGNPGLISRINSINPGSPTFRQEIAHVAGSLSKVNNTSAENTPLYNGLKPATAIAVRGIVSGFKTEPAVTNFVQVQEAKNFVNSIPNKTKNPADDQALVYALAKALDPGSVVREGEYATAQKYAQSWVKAYGKAVTQALDGTGFLSETARKNIKDTINNKYKATKTSYDTVYNSYAKQVNSLTGRQDGADFLRDYQVQETPITPSQENPLGLSLPSFQSLQSNPLELTIFQK